MAEKIEVQEFNFFDKEEVITDCYVQVLENSVTGQTSIGWGRLPRKKWIKLDELFYCPHCYKGATLDYEDNFVLGRACTYCGGRTIKDEWSEEYE